MGLQKIRQMTSAAFPTTGLGLIHPALLIAAACEILVDNNRLPYAACASDVERICDIV